jgi:hypothetical protein
MNHAPTQKSCSIRFVRGIIEALQIAVGLFRQRNSVRSGRSTSVTDYRGFVSSRGRGAARTARRQPFRHGFGEPVAPNVYLVDGLFCRAFPEYRGFVSRRPLGPLGRETLGVTGSPNPCGTGSDPQEWTWKDPAYSGNSMYPNIFCHALLKSRGFVSSADFGSFGEPIRRYRLPWLRFVKRPRHATHGDGLPGTGSENPWHPGWTS